MRSYALLIFALAVLYARAATIPVPKEAEKLSSENEALDNVSLDNNVSEQKLSDQPDIIKEAENDIPTGNVPVEIIEEKPILKTIALKEDSNDYVPDNDDSAYIKRVEIDLNNPGPPQRQEHNSQNPVNYAEKEKAVAAVQKSIAESQNIFNRALQDVTQVFQDFAANKENLEGVQTNIQTLKQNVNVQVTKLSDTINSYLNPEGEKIIEDADVSHIEEVKNSLRSLQVKINSGMDVLSQGADVLSILKEEDETDLPDKISGKADNVNVASTATGPSPAPTAPVSSTIPPAQTNPFVNFMTSFQSAVGNAFTNIGDMFQNFVSPNQDQNQNQNQQPQGTAPAGAQSDEPSSTQSPNFFQYVSNLINPVQNNQQQSQQNQNQNPTFPQFPNIGQFISNMFQPKPQQTNQQTAQTSNVNQPAPDQTIRVTPAPAQVSNAVPAAPASPVQPQPALASQTVQNTPAQGGPIQQIVQNNPIVKGITNAVQRIQGLSNPSKPRDVPDPPRDEKHDAKGHGSSTSNAANGDNNISNSSGVNEISAPTKSEPETISEIKNEEQVPVAEPNKTE